MYPSSPSHPEKAHLECLEEGYYLSSSGGASGGALGGSSADLGCYDGVWKITGTGAATPPIDMSGGVTCEEGCSGGCLNGGYCIGMNYCSCTPGYGGSRCEEQGCLELESSLDFYGNIYARWVAG